MRIPVHSPWLPRSIDDVQTVLITLTMAGLFLDRPCILKKESSTFYDILNVMFEKNHRDDLRIFESKQSKTETPKIILWIYGIEVV